MALTFHFAARSDVGLVRKDNQDSGYASPRLLVITDGMGGATSSTSKTVIVAKSTRPGHDVVGGVVGGSGGTLRAGRSRRQAG